MNQSVLVIDDDIQISKLIESAVMLNNGSAKVLNDPNEFSSELLQQFSLIFLDLNMPGKDGIEIINELAAQQFPGQLVLISGFDDWMLNNAKSLAEAKGLRVLNQLTKPFRLEDIESVLEAFSLQAQGTNGNSSSQSSSEDIPYSEIVKAIKGKRVKVFYQPQMDLISHSLIGVEALIRIENDEGGLITPNLFLKVAEQEKLIHELTKVIIKTAFRDYQNRIQQYSQLVLSINLSAQDIEDVSFPDWLITQAQKYQIEPSHVVFELNNIDKIKNLDKALEVLMRLRLKGFKISLDEFGTGQSVLDVVKQFPVTEVKIHPSFISDILENSKSQLLLKSTIHMCLEVGLDLVVNGIENQEMESLLVELGAFIGQGYLYSKPLPLEQVVKLLKESSDQTVESSIAYLENEPDDSVARSDENADYESVNITKQRQKRYTAYQQDKKAKLLLSPLPLSGQLAYIGNSQLLGFELALIAFRKQYPGARVELGVFDDQSDFDRHLQFYQDNVPDRTLGIVGGAFAYQKTEQFAQHLRKYKTPIIAPFNGCSRLRDSNLDYVYNFKPSFKAEIDHIVNKHLSMSKDVLVLKPKQHLLHEYRHLEKHYPDWSYKYYQQHKTTQLVDYLHKNRIKKVLFIGSAKYLIDLMEAVDNPEVEFFAASLTGFSLVNRTLKRKARINLTVTDPMPDYLDEYTISKQYQELVSGIETDQKRYVNGISFEAYLIMTVLLQLIESRQVRDSRDIQRELAGLIGHEIGLDDRLTFSPQHRTLMHKIYERKI